MKKCIKNVCKSVFKEIFFCNLMENKKHICELCNKIYKTSQSLWNHKNKYHTKNDQKMTNYPPNTHNTPTFYPPNTNINIENETTSKKTDQTVCKYCNKNYSCYNSLNRHLQICKEKEKKLMEYDELKKELEELKVMMLEMMNNKYKMHPKKMQKIINTTNNSNTNTNSNNNVTINNNQINIIELGDEKLNDIFTKEEKLKILKRGYSSLEEIIRHAHLNKKYLQFQNIIITNKRNNDAYMYNSMLKKFILVDKIELLDNLIEYRFDDLSAFYDEHKNKLEPKLRINLEKMFELKDDDEYGKRKRDEFNILFYNESNKDLLKIKNELE